MKRLTENERYRSVARNPFANWFSVGCVGLALCLGAGASHGFAQQAPSPQDQGAQDQGPPQYPQQAPQDQTPQDQAPQDQAPQDQAPQDQAPQDQGPPQNPQQGAQQQDASQSPEQGPAQSAGSVARLSFVQGDVKIVSSGETDFQQAVVNMPLLAGSSLQTGTDGETEVEFDDGSVARLTPNSSFALNHLGQDGVQMQQNSGLAYYELNVGQGHPPFQVEFPGAQALPTANAIIRLALDSAPELAVTSGAVEVSGNGIPATTVSDNQSIRFQPGSNAPYTIAQSINPDSWDQWNQDRDQAISQEASQQTSVRDDSGNPGDENWNDLDYYGNWYPVGGSGNVWVPAGVDAGWDPYGSGYWGFYPGFGYTWISAYPWGWLPYHCGAWNYYSFGWGWAPGGCGRAWVPVAGIRGYPGYFLPARPVWHTGHGFPLPSHRLVTVDRGPRAIGAWGATHPVPVTNHQETVNLAGRPISPIGRSTFGAQGFVGNRGTTPGMRTLLGNNVRGAYQHGGIESRPPVQPPIQSHVQPVQPRPNSFNRPDSRSMYSPRTMPSPHYSPPPPPMQRSSPPPQPHYSPPPAGGGARGHR